MKKTFGIAFTLLCLSVSPVVNAGTNTEINVNPEVTTHIVMPENITMVDISTDKIVGDQCTDNIVRLKPRLDDDGKYADYEQNEHMATVTIIGERHIAQFDLIYRLSAKEADSFYEVAYSETNSYTNPEIAMPKDEMARYAWAVASEKRHYNNVKSVANGMKARVNNIYSVGDYFFLDYTLENKTKIPYDIDEVRVKLTDKREAKATNVQTVEIKPVFSLNKTKKFKKKLRNVLVLEKLTFPEDKILKLEISESQISGRIINLEIEYEDILNADGFDMTKINQIRNAGRNVVNIVQPTMPVNAVEYSEYNRVCQERDALVDELEDIKSELNKLSNDYETIENAYSTMAKSMSMVSYGKGSAAELKTKVTESLEKKGRKK